MFALKKNVHLFNHVHIRTLYDLLRWLKARCCLHIYVMDFGLDFNFLDFLVVHLTSTSYTVHDLSVVHRESAQADASG